MNTFMKKTIFIIWLLWNLGEIINFLNELIMKERIKYLKNLFDNGIIGNVFFKMILHITDDCEIKSRAYSNYLGIEDWKKLYAKKPNPNLILNDEQISSFFNYLSRYHGDYFGKNQNYYYVNKNFFYEQTNPEDFIFESIVFTTLEIL